MKRTGFARQVIERRPRTVVVTPGLFRLPAQVGDAAAVPKAPPVRAPAYLRWIATLPCIVCGIEGYTQAAHQNKDRGLGQKSSDLDCFPLCCTRPGHMGHHMEHDLLIDMTLDQRRELETMYTRKTQERARAAGRPEFQDEA